MSEMIIILKRNHEMKKRLEKLNQEHRTAEIRLTQEM